MFLRLGAQLVFCQDIYRFIADRKQGCCHEIYPCYLLLISEIPFIRKIQVLSMINDIDFHIPGKFI